MAKEQIPPLKQLKEYLTPATYNSLTRTCMPSVMGLFEIISYPNALVVLWARV